MKFRAKQLQNDSFPFRWEVTSAVVVVSVNSSSFSPRASGLPSSFSRPRGGPCWPNLAPCPGRRRQARVVSRFSSRPTMGARVCLNKMALDLSLASRSQQCEQKVTHLVRQRSSTRVKWAHPFPTPPRLHSRTRARRDPTGSLATNKWSITFSARRQDADPPWRRTALGGVELGRGEGVGAMKEEGGE